MKNKMMRLASLLMVAVLLTTSVVSGTYAKYVTTQTGSDKARVAKWGVEIVANGDTFAETYTSDYGVSVKSIAANDADVTDDVLAPGTEGTLVAMVLSGTPEVAVEVKYTPTLLLQGWEINGVEYCPIVFTVNNLTYGTDDTGLEVNVQCSNVADLKAKVEAAINGYTATYEPLTNLATETEVATPDVTWTWPYSTGDANDANDTTLGNQAANASAPTIQLDITTTVTQID